MEIIILHGHVGKAPEMRYTPSGSAVTSFSLATNKQWTGNDGTKHKETHWWKVTFWGKMAEIVNQYVEKGQMLLVTCEIQLDKDTHEPRIWTTKEGKARASLEVTGRTFEFGGGSGSHEGNSNGEENPFGADADPEIEPDIPF